MFSLAQGSYYTCRDYVHFSHECTSHKEIGVSASGAFTIKVVYPSLRGGLHYCRGGTQVTRGGSIEERIGGWLGAQRSSGHGQLCLIPARPDT